MSTATPVPTPAPAPAASIPLDPRHVSTALGVIWGAAMLGLLAFWLGKLEPPPPIGPNAVAINPPPGWALAVLWALSVVGFLTGAWYYLSMRKLAMTANPAAEAGLTQKLGLVLIGAGVLLAFLGVYLVWTLRMAGFAESVGLCMFSLIPLIGGLVLQKGPGSGDLVTFMLPRADLLAKALLVVGSIGIVVFLWLAMPFGKKLGTAWLPELGALVFESLLLLTAGFWLLTSTPADRTPFAMRCVLLVLGGVTGLIITLESFFRTLLWREDVLMRGMGGWLGNNSWEFWLCAYVGLIGIALMFVSMLLARTEIRTQPQLRQALFGFNAVASGILLVAFLAAINVLIYATFPLTSEWSQRGLVSLSDSSKTILGLLKNKTPVTAYVLLSQNSPLYTDVKNLLDNCQAAAPADKFVVKYVPPESDSGIYNDLAERFPELSPVAASILGARREVRGRGVLLVQGPLPSDLKAPVPPRQFIADKKLIVVQQSEFGAPGAGAKRVFMGEVEIMGALSFLLRGQTRHKLYVLQGDKELDINSNDSDDPFGGGLLVDRLKKDNYEVQGLNFGKQSFKKNEKPSENVVFVEPSGPDKRKEVPADAWAVLVPGPIMRIPKETLDALERYMDKRDGRMLVALDLQITEDRTQFRKSGIEDLLKKYGVLADEGYVVRGIFMRGYPNPLIVVGSAPGDTTNEFAKKFVGRGFEFNVVRVVRPSPTPTGKFKAEVLFHADREFTADDRPYLVDNDVGIINPDRYFKINRRQLFQEDPVPIAVAVSEEGIRPDEKKGDRVTRPCMVVFGSKYFMSNREMFSSGATNYSLVSGALEWMGERPVLGIRPREQPNYALNPETQVGRMIFVPLWLMGLSTLGLGIGVWVVRRR